jgi:thioesterase domain-containing protein
MNSIKPVESLGLTLRVCDDHCVEVLIPFSENYNDKDMIFAGSLFSGAVISGYQLVQNMMRAQGLTGALVCRDAAIRYQKPVFKDAAARAKSADGFSPTSNGNRWITVTVDLLNEKNETSGEAKFTYVLVKDPELLHPQQR